MQSPVERPSKVSETIPARKSPTRSREREIKPSYPSPPTSPLQHTLDGSASRNKTRGACRSSSEALPGVAAPASVRNEQCLPEPDSIGTRDATTLRCQLGLDGGRCGGSKKNNEPCRVPILKKNEEEIESLLQSMASSMWLLPEVEMRLGDLVNRVHCHWHDHGASRDARLEAWRKCFRQKVPGDTAPVARVEDLIQRVIGPVYTECRQSSGQGQVCKQRIGGQKVYSCTRSIIEITKPRVYLNDAYLTGLLRVLERNSRCEIHEQDGDIGRVEHWQTEIRRILTLHNRTQLVSSDSQPKIPVSSHDLATFWSEVYDTSPFEILGSWEASRTPSSNASPYGTLQHLLMHPVDSADMKSGFVYLFEVGGNKGFVKIGHTTRPMQVRHEEWRFNCNRNPENIYPSPSDAAKMVAYAPLIEKLCHLELERCRVRIYCRGCMQQHIEWFKISLKDAIAVIQKWVKWMATEPYLTRQLRTGARGYLTAAENRKTNDMNKFMRDISRSTESDDREPPSSRSAPEQASALAVS